MKIIASIKKSENVRFISHLDVQRMLQRTVRRADIPVAFSPGFNPHPLISFATALATGQTGDCEWIEIKFEKEMEINDFVNRMNKSFPDGFEITNAFIAKEGMPAVANLMVSATYCVYTSDVVEYDVLESSINSLMSSEIIVKKHKKQNGKKITDAEVDIRPLVYEFTINSCDETGIKLHIKGRLDVAGGLNADLLLKSLNEKLGRDILWHIHRKSIELKEY